MKKLPFLLLLLTQIAWTQTRQTDPLSGKMGFADAKGTLIIPMEYDYLEAQLAPFMIARKGDFKGVLDEGGHILIPFEYRDIQAIGQYFLVSKDNSARPAWGLLDSNGGIILEMVYEYIATAGSNLLAARLFSSKDLKFFDGRGKFLFEVSGALAMPGFDGNSILIQRANRSCYWTDRQGQEIAPPLFENTSWSDGDFFILMKQSRFGVVNAKGETVVPFQYMGIVAGNKGHFIVTDSTYREGLMDAHGQYLIPPGKGNIMRLGKKQEGDAYFVRRYGEFESKLYAPDGKTLIQDACSVLPLITTSQWSKFPENRYEQYDWVDVKKTGLRALYRSDGKQILPPEFKRIQYFSERHPLVACSVDKKEKDYSCAVYNLEGKLLLEQRYFSLDFTENPRFLIGQAKAQGLFGFIDLNAPEKAAFIYQKLNWFNPGYYSASKDTMQLLLTPEGKVVYAHGASEMTKPQQWHFRRFQETEGTSGTLVAVFITKEGIANNTWIGVNDAGEAFTCGVKNYGSDLTQPTTLEAPDESEIITVAEQSPRFPGGDEALLKFIQSNMKYPKIAQENGIAGTVVAAFTIEEDGSITNPQIVRDIGNGCGREVLRLISLMPKWIPGTQNGEVVRVRYILPVKFHLD